MRSARTKEPLDVAAGAAAAVSQCWLHGPEEEIPPGETARRSSATELGALQTKPEPTRRSSRSAT